MKKIIKRTIIFAALALCACLLFSCSKKPLDFDLAEYIELGDYPKVAYDKEELDESVQKSLDAIAEEHKETVEVTDRTKSEDGDVVTVDYVGKVNGEEFEGGSATDSQITLGLEESGYIDGFAEGMVGKEKDKAFDLNLKFPEVYDNNPDLAGKDVVFTVTIKKISKENIPELTDEMVEEDTDFTTVDAYKEHLTETWLKDNLWSNFVDSTKVIKYPEAERDEIYKNAVTMYMNYAVNYLGATTKNFYSTWGYDSLDAFRQAMLKQANSTVKEEMIIYYISRNKGVEITDEEYNKLCNEKMAEQSLNSISALEDNYGGKDGLMLEYLRDKIIDTILEASK